MGKQDCTNGQTQPAATSETAVAALAVEAANSIDVSPRMALVGRPPAQEPMDLSSVLRHRADTNGIHDAKLDLTSMEAPRIAPEIADPKPALSEEPPESAANEAVPEPPAATSSPRINRFTLLAACLALAAAFGSMVGALAAFAVARPQPVSVLAAAKLTPEEIQALKENVVQARVELAALRASLDAGNRGATTQLTKIAERVERIERNGAEPTAKLTKAAESLERLVRSELTGTIAPPQPAGGGSAGKLDGWIVRDVHRGVAVLEGRAGAIEVEQGDLIPGLGRVDSIRKQDGRWIVVTSKGVISAPR
jgi:hypothetical protein